MDSRKVLYAITPGFQVSQSTRVLRAWKLACKEGDPKSCTTIELVVLQQFPVSYGLTHAEKPGIPYKIEAARRHQEIQKRVQRKRFNLGHSKQL
jgi:hypothetical protein